MNDRLRYADAPRRRAFTSMPGPVLLTAVAFAVLAVLFTLAVLLRMGAEDGTLAAAVFFAALATACAVTTVGLTLGRPWSLPLSHGLAGLLAAASLGLFGAVTLVGVALVGWVVWALTRPVSREWLTG